MVEFTVQVKNKKELDMKIQRLEKSLNKSPREIAQRMGLRGLLIARKKAPTGVRPANASLRTAITFQTKKTGNGHQARIWVKSSNKNNLIAIANEFGVRERTYYVGPGTDQTELRNWMFAKGKDPDKQVWFTVGGKGTRLGKRNKFWKPSYLQLEKQIENITEEVVTRRVMKIFNS